MQKASIILYTEWRILIDGLSDANKLRFYDLLMNYSGLDYNPEIEDLHLKSVFNFVLIKIKENDAEWHELREKKREAAQIRWGSRTTAQTAQESAQDSKDTAQDLSAMQNEISSADKGLQSNAMHNDAPHSSAMLNVNANVNANAKEKNKTKKEITAKQVESKFQEFYDLYPNKVDRKRALGKYTSMKLWESHERIMNGLNQYLRWYTLMRKRDQFVPEHKHPTTWLNNACWENEYKTSSQERLVPAPRAPSAAEVIKEKYDAVDMEFQLYKVRVLNERHGKDGWTTFVKLAKNGKVFVTDKDELKIKLKFAQEFPEKVSEIKKLREQMKVYETG